jgi:tRNA(fMet)-specific endonuclease VapC
LKLALDTNTYTDLCRGAARVVELVRDAEAVFLPFVVVAELRAGFALGRRSAENERVLHRFLAKPGVAALFADEQTTRHYATLFGDLRRRGKPIPVHDLWIAALVLQHGLTLCARDRHFDHLPQIPRA